MISASARPGPLLRTLTAKAERIGQRRALVLARRLSSGPLDWRSAASLWPDFEQD